MQRFMVQRRAFAIVDRYVGLRVADAPTRRKAAQRQQQEQRQQEKQAKQRVKQPKRQQQHKEQQQEEQQQQQLLSLSAEQQSYVCPADSSVVQVALVGLANAGKSTLLNTLVGQSLAAVSDKPHTTRDHLLGVVTRHSAQVAFLDTPGVVSVREAADRAREVVTGAWTALDEADAAVVVIDALTAASDWRLEELAQRLLKKKNFPEHVALAVNKVDAVASPADLLAALDKIRQLGFPGADDPFLISALRGTHVSDLLDYLFSLCQPGPWLLGQGEVTDKDLVWRVEEAVRQSLFQHLRQELPYALRQRSVGMRSTEEALFIDQEVLVPKLSQARMAIGRGGRVAKTVSEEAAAAISQIVGKKVVLSLHMKVDAKDPAASRDHD